MTSPPDNSTPRRHGAARLLLAAGLALGGGAWMAACATAESLTFSSEDCVAGGCAQGGVSSSTSASSSSSSASSGGPCTVNPGCSVTWGADIFAGMLDTPAAGCTAKSLCHGDGKGGLTLEAGKPHEAYLTLTAYTLLAQPGPAKKYIVPCDKTNSGMLCNMKQDAANPNGDCGSLMPLVGTNLTPEQLNKIADWIACGAPEN